MRGEEDAAPKLSISSIQALEDVKIKLPDALRIKIPLHNPDAMLLDEPEAPVTEVKTSPAAGLFLAALVAFLLAAGVVWDPLMAETARAVRGFGGR